MPRNSSVSSARSRSAAGRRGAIYHSHTHSEGYPSQTDRDRSKYVVAFYPDVRFLILSLEDREAPVLRSFFIRDGEVTEEELTIT